MRRCNPPLESINSRRINKSRSVRCKRTSNWELNRQLAQSLHRTINHATNKSKSNHHGSRPSSRKSRTRANEQSSTNRASDRNHLQVAAFESLRELIGLLHVRAVRIAVRSDLPRRLDVGEIRSRFEGVDKASEAFTRGGRSTILGAAALVARDRRGGLYGVAHLHVVHGGEEVVREK